MISFLKLAIFFVLLSAVFTKPPPSPVYSAKYSEIRYQPSENGESHKAELNLEEKQREEVTERSSPKAARPPSATNEKSPDTSAESFEITTEPESEQINFARFVHRNIVKDKLVEDETVTKKFNHENATQSTTVDKANTTKCHENRNKQRGNKETLENLDGEEHVKNIEIEENMKKMEDTNIANNTEIEEEQVTKYYNEQKNNTTRCNENANLSKEDKLVKDETVTKKFNQENETESTIIDKANTTKCHENINVGSEDTESVESLDSKKHVENLEIEGNMKKVVDTNTANKTEIEEEHVTKSFNEQKDNTTRCDENANLSKEDFIKKNTEEIENIQNREVLESTSNEGNVEASENLEDINESELSDLNNQGVYYIFHPEMLLQKVVYKTPENSKYENVAPIVEHFYTYDPRTFILQRLILRP